MADLTEAQRAECYFFCGWPQRWVQVNTALEQALNKINTSPAQAALLTNGLFDSPVGILAQLRQHYDVTIPGAYRRLKALKVGSIELSGNGELRALEAQGQRLVNALCSILGVESDADVFKPGRGSRTGARMGGFSPGGDGGNWIGK